MTKLCKDCRFYDVGPARCFDRCSKSALADYVRGTEPLMDYCASLRDNPASCGPKGQWFAPRPEHQQVAE